MNYFGTNFAKAEMPAWQNRSIATLSHTNYAFTSNVLFGGSKKVIVLVKFSLKVDDLPYSVGCPNALNLTECHEGYLLDVSSSENNDEWPFIS